MVKKHLQVFARLKPLQPSNQPLPYLALTDNTLQLQVSRTKLSNAKDNHSFTFNRIFPDSDSQSRGRQFKHKSTELLQDVIQTRIHNHFENNEFLGKKKALYYNMKAYYKRNRLQVFDQLPVTFHVKRYGDEAWLDFSSYYAEDQKAKKQGEQRLWIVKPGENSNRGNGITIYSDFDKIKAWVKSQISGENNPKKTFIIQKHIDRPLLYNKRKFDIRCYMLLVQLNGKTRGYWYDEGYIRTSCYEFQLGEMDNEFIHLTNDAIQVNSQKYGKYEDGNKLSYHHFQKYLDGSQKHLNFQEQICPQLKEICRHAVEASYHLLGKWNGLPTFQVFGLDFMIDEDCKPWLIEINTNPCLQTSSTTLQRVIPRMVDNAFKLSLDVLFPPPLSWQNSKKHYLPNRASHNLFSLIFDEAKTCPSPNRQVILQMGEIQQDNEVYEQEKEKKAEHLSSIPDWPQFFKMNNELLSIGERLEKAVRYGQMERRRERVEAEAEEQVAGIQESLLERRNREEAEIESAKEKIAQLGQYLDVTVRTMSVQSSKEAQKVASLRD